MIDQEVVRGLYYAQTPADGTPKQKADARRQQFKRALDWAEAQELIASHEIDDVVYLRLCRHEAGSRMISFPTLPTTRHFDFCHRTKCRAARRREIIKNGEKQPQTPLFWPKSRFVGPNE